MLNRNQNSDIVNLFKNFRNSRLLLEIRTYLFIKYYRICMRNILMFNKYYHFYKEKE